MKTKRIMKITMCLLLLVTIGISSCKKKDPAPNPSANTDNVDMGTSGSTIVNVLSNDSYSGNAVLTITNNFNYGTLVVNTDKTITFTSRANFYGTDYVHYNIDYQLFDLDKFVIFSYNQIIPEIGYNTYSILSDGSISTLANDGNSTVILQMVGEFTASAKKRDGSGQYMTVSGYTLKYGTDVLDFTTRID